MSGPQPGFRNWVARIANYYFLGCPVFRGRPKYTQITTINIYLLNEIRHNIPKQCHGSYIVVKKSTMFENDILRKSSQDLLGVLTGDF